MRGQGTFFDGLSAGRHLVQVGLSQDRQALLIEGDTLPEALRWPLADLRALSDHAEDRQLVLTRHLETEDEAPRDPARLVLDDPVLVKWLRQTRPSLNRRDLRKGTRRRIVRNVGLAVGALAMMLFVILPAMANTMARLIPLETEVSFGKSVLAQMERVLGAESLGALRCQDEDGLAALDKMVARITEGQQIDYDLNVLVFDHKMINAFAAPGGQVVLLRGLIEASDGPDAVAAVLAHEIGHVVNRDATRNALRAAGSAGLLSLVLGDIAGGAVLVAVADQMLNSSYTRDAERAADLYALEALNAAEVSSEGMGAFFDTLAEQEGGFSLPEYLATHPVTAERAAQARQNASGQTGTSPVLSADDWAALQSVCAKD